MGKKISALLSLLCRRLYRLLRLADNREARMKFLIEITCIFAFALLFATVVFFGFDKVVDFANQIIVMMK
jgi:hypothetical protein